MQHPAAFPISQRGAFDGVLARECTVELKYFITLRFGKTTDLLNGDLRIVWVHYVPFGAYAGYAIGNPANLATRSYTYNNRMQPTDQSTQVVFWKPLDLS